MSRKNPFKGALVLTVIALSIAALSYFVIKPRHDAAEQKKDKSTLLFSELERAKVVEFQITNPNGSFSLKRRAEDNQKWLVSDGSKTYDADFTTIDGILSTILAAKKESSVNAGEATALGLAPPKYRLHVAVGTGDAAKREIYLGEDTPVDYMVYSKWSDAPDTFLTTRSLRFALDKKLAELRNKRVFTNKAEELAHVELKLAAADKAPARTIVLDRGADGNWTSPLPANLGGGAVKLDKDQVVSWLGSLRDLNVVDFASESAAERAKLGFAHPAAVLSIKASDPKTAPSTWLLASVKDPKAGRPKHYFARQDQESTYEVAETFRDNFKIDLMRFRPKTILLSKKDEIKGLVVHDGAIQFSFSKDAAGTWKGKYKNGKKELEGYTKLGTVDHVIDSLVALRASEYLDGQKPAQLGLSKPSRVVEIRALRDGKEDVVATLIFGKKVPKDMTVVRTEDLDAAASVLFKTEEILSMKPESFLETTAAPPPASAPTAANAAGTTSAEGAKKVKLEPSVQDLKELRKLPGPIVKAGHKYTAEIELAKGGKIVIAFDSEKAPYTVSNFIHLARNHFYDGLKFHRVIKGFMAQGGDPTGTGTGGPGWKFDNEMSGIKHKRGVISMANAGRNTNGSQFFIMFEPAPHLDSGDYTSFGEMTAGLESLDAIQMGDVMKKVEVFEE